jgi:hypothetical protein
MKTHVCVCMYVCMYVSHRLGHKANMIYDFVSRTETLEDLWRFGEGEVCQNVGNLSSSGFKYDVRIVLDLRFSQRYGSGWFA